MPEKKQQRNSVIVQVGQQIIMLTFGDRQDQLMENLNMRTGRWVVYGCAHKVMNTIDIQEIWST